MKQEKLFEFMKDINNEYVEEVKQPTKIKSLPIWIKWVTVAACLCFLASGTVLGAKLLKQQSGAVGSNITNNQDSVLLDANVASVNAPTGDAVEDLSGGIFIPSPIISLAANDNENLFTDMIGFFIYQGYCYFQYDSVDNNTDLIGNRLGTSTGLIDEWTSSDGYVDYAGTVSGDFYTVNGYDPSFMLCMKNDLESVELYICTTGITVKYVSDLYTDRLNLAENYTDVEFESNDSRKKGKNQIHKIEDNEDIIQQFIKDLNSAKFVSCDSVFPNDDNIVSLRSKADFLYFYMKNGTVVRLCLLKNGYVSFFEFYDVCVKLPQKNYNSLLNIIESYK